MTTPEIKKGLDGVYVDTNNVSKVMADSNSLTYRGYAVEELCELKSFEDVAYLLLNGELPDASERKAFVERERALRQLSPEALKVIKLLPTSTHPMDMLKTVVSFLGSQDSRIWESSEEVNKDKSMGLLAKIPTAIAAFHRHKQGKDAIAPKDELSISENFFHMYFGEVPEPEIVKTFDVTLILYAEHGFNASTFTARVITSTLSDYYSAVVGAIGALKGPLHGGANEQVMYTLKEVGSPEKAKEWLTQALAEKRKIMGFGHRVYKSGDSRVPTMNAYLEKVTAITGQRQLFETAKILESAMIEAKGIHPNVDFPTGPAYYMMGIDIDMFTPIFVMSRITGWSAHIIEQLRANRLIRPLSFYNGPSQRHVPQ